MKNLFAAALVFSSFFCPADTRAQLRVDNSNIINKLFSFYAFTPPALNDYFWNGGFKEKDLTSGKYLIKQYAIPGAADSYMLTLLNSEIFAVTYKTHDKQQFLNAVAVVKKMGFAPIAAARPERFKTVYGKPESYDRIMTLEPGNSKNAFYLIQVNNLTIAARQMKL